MTGLITRTSILAISKLAVNALMFLSPIFLVRLLDVYNYGQYREFMLYAMLLFHILSFNINSNLIYFISKDESGENGYIIHTIVFCFASFLIGGIFIYCGQNFILAKTSFDFVLPLMLYLFFTLNMNFWRSYWLGKKRVDFILYYSVFYTFIRMSAVIATAYITQSVDMVIISIVLVEGLRFLFDCGFFIKKIISSVKINTKIAKEQLIYFVPLGISEVLLYLNNEVSKLFIVSAMGVQSLAIYSIGAYQLPLINIIKMSIIDAVFPEIIRRNIKDRFQGLLLWKKINVICCAIFFPAFSIFFYYADLIIITLFTSAYEESVPIFKVYLFFLLLKAFEMTIPLKSLNLNKYFIYAGLIRLVINIVLMTALFKFFGLLAPALALVIANFLTSCFLFQKIQKTYKIRIYNLLMWKKLFKILSATLVSLPILFSGAFVNLNIYLEAVIFSGLYFAFFVAILLNFRIEEINTLVQYFRKKVKWLTP